MKFILLIIIYNYSAGTSAMEKIEFSSKYKCEETRDEVAGMLRGNNIKAFCIETDSK